MGRVNRNTNLGAPELLKKSVTLPKTPGTESYMATLDSRIFELKIGNADLSAPNSTKRQNERLENKRFYYMTSSVSGQDEPNRAL